MKKPLFLLLLSIAALQSAHAQSYIMRIPQPGMTQSPLTVTSVSPAAGPYGATTQFTLTGENFDETLVVEVGAAAAICGAPTKTTVTCTSPMQPADGSYPVVAHRQDGGRDATKSFTYTPTGPTGSLVKISSSQVASLTISPGDELLYSNGGYVNKIAATGAYLGNVFAGTSSNSFATPSGCVSNYAPSVKSIAVDAAGNLYLAGSCSNSAGYESAAVWRKYSTSYATALTQAWGGSGNHNGVDGLAASGNTLFLRFWTSFQTGTYQAQTSTANGVTTSLPSAPWSSNPAYAGAPYIVNTSGQLARYVSGNSWTPVGPALAGNPNGSFLTASADGFLYYVPGNATVLYKLNPATGATVKSWPLSGLTGGLTGLAVSSSGKPFISTYSGIWRMD